MNNINTQKYWERRFLSGNWRTKNGEMQTRLFAEEQVRKFGLGSNYGGTIVDFGCASGDAIPVYREHFPCAKLFGVDFAPAAIQNAKEKYGNMAAFVVGSADEVPLADVIVASNVFGHLDDHVSVAAKLLKRAHTLHIIVPYREYVDGTGEHINSYDENAFSSLGLYESHVYISNGWSEFGLKQLFVDVYLKNLVRPFFLRRIRRRRRQIMFSFRR